MTTLAPQLKTPLEQALFAQEMERLDQEGKRRDDQAKFEALKKQAAKEAQSRR